MVASTARKRLKRNTAAFLLSRREPRKGRKKRRLRFSFRPCQGRRNALRATRATSVAPCGALANGFVRVPRARARADKRPCGLDGLHRISPLNAGWRTPLRRYERGPYSTLVPGCRLPPLCVAFLIPGPGSRKRGRLATASLRLRLPAKRSLPWALAFHSAIRNPKSAMPFLVPVPWSPFPPFEPCT